MAVYSIHRPPVVRRSSAYASLDCRWAAFLIDTGIFLFIQSFSLFFLIGYPFAEAEHGKIFLPQLDIFLSNLGYIGKFVYANFFFFLAHWIYNAYMESSEKQGTIGKIVLGMKVTDLNGKRLGFGAASVRYLAKYLSAGTLLLGFIVAFFNRRCQALHDIIAGSTVRMRKS